MYNCPIHELNSASTTCEHVADAIDAKQFRPAHVAIDFWNEPTTLCDSCQDELVRRTANLARWATDDVEGVRWVRVCYTCLKEWYLNTRQGDLLDAIHQTRAEKAASVTGKFLVPGWLLGTERYVLKMLVPVAMGWARAYRQHGIFPELFLADPKDLDIILYNISDYQPDQLAVRLYANRELYGMVSKELEPIDHEQLKVDYETHVATAPWGALENLLFERSPASLAHQCRRYSQVLPHLDILGRGEVVSVNRQRRTALAELDRCIGRTLENWGAPAAGPLAARIEFALEVMRNASPAYIDEQIVQRVLELAPVVPQVKHHDRFTRDSVRLWVTSLDTAAREHLTGCAEASLLSAVVEFDRLGTTKES